MSRRYYLLVAFLLVSISLRAESGDFSPLMGKSIPAGDKLANHLGATVLTFDDVRSGTLANYDVLVWTSHSTRIPTEAKDQQVVDAVKQFINGGGGLFLSSFAEAYAVDLGLETTYPNRMDFYRHGAYGSASYFSQGFRAKASHPLFNGLTPSSDGSDIYYIAGSYCLLLESGFWENQTINAQFLASYFRNKGGSTFSGPEHHTLNLWELGQGKVLGYAQNLFLEDFWHNTNRDNLYKFLDNAMLFLSGQQSPRIAALPELPGLYEYDQYISAPAEPTKQPPNLLRSLPGLPYICHWGWLGAINYQRVTRDPVGVDYFKQYLIDEAVHRGANLLEFYPPSMISGFPFTWPTDDPIPRPGKYVGGNFWPEWDWDKAREVITHAHQKDMIIHTFYHPNPVQTQSGESSTDVFSRFVELQARELQNPLLHGWQAAQDGLGYEFWYNDKGGETFASSWLYNPGSYNHSTNMIPGARGLNFTGTWQCAWGRVGGVHSSGFADEFRYMIHPPLYLSYQADCREDRASGQVWGSWANFGGGSYPDFILRQVNDFCRHRLFLTSGIWWLGETSPTLRGEFRDYVYGVTQDPIRTAVTTRLYALGEGGYRQLSAGAYSGVPDEWINLVPYPVDTSIIQNNHLRLLRMAGEDRGVLLYDPTRLAHYQGDKTLTLSRDFISGHPVNATPPVGPINTVAIALDSENGSSSEFRGSGGYDRTYQTQSVVAQFPAEIQYEGDPSWPQHVEMSFNADAGRYALEVVSLPVSSEAIIEVYIDEQLIGFYFPDPGTTSYHVPFSLTEQGGHILRLSCQRASGRAHAFDALRIRRTADTAATHKHTMKAGHRALMYEEIASDADAGYRQVRRYQIDNDNPMLLVELENVAPQPTVWETRLSLPGYEMQPADDPHMAWRLVGDGSPTLGLFIMGLDVESVTKDNDDVVLRFASRNLSCARLALIVEDDLYQKEDYANLQKALFARTPRIDLKSGKAQYANSLPLAYVQVVQVDNPNDGPYLISEEGPYGDAYWMARGAQSGLQYTTMKPLCQSSKAQTSNATCDYLKLYLQPKATAKVRPFDFIDGVVKPGYGCQYALAIRDNITPRRCEVRVVKTGQFLFAPRIEWKEPFDSAQVNGQEWRYFEDGIVYLPNQPGDYVVEVEASGSTKPHIGRTFLDVVSAKWNQAGDYLELETRAPHWWQGPLPANQPYKALLYCDRQPGSIEGSGRVIDWNEYRASAPDRSSMSARGAMIELWPGTARVHFSTHESVVQIPAASGPIASHWFGYYDKFQFDPTDRYVLCNEVDFDTREPLPDDVIRLGYIDLQGSRQFVQFATTTAWCWQQACMLQWIPNSTSEVIYNAREGDHFIAVIQNVFTGAKRTISRPISTLNSDGRSAIGFNYSRLDDTRSGYGYEGIADPWGAENHPAEDGLYHIDLISGSSQLILSLDHIARFERTIEAGEGKHWFNVPIFNPSGTRFLCLNRYQKASGGYHTRMFTANPDGSDIYIVDTESTSHLIWKNDTQIICWTWTTELGTCYTLFTDKMRKVEAVGKGILTQNGHMTYSPDGQWILTDTYPDGNRQQTVMLFRPADSRLVVLGKFYSPSAYRGQWRCDTHPRWNRDGKTVCFDSSLSGRRQMYLIDVSLHVNAPLGEVEHD
jgi:Domain of unknown function (DUF4960)